MKRFLQGLGLAIAVLALMAADTVLRARHAYLEGERCLSSGDTVRARAWFENAAQSFNSPESRWSKLAREKLTQLHPDVLE